MKTEITYGTCVKSLKTQSGWFSLYLRFVRWLRKSKHVMYKKHGTIRFSLMKTETTPHETSEKSYKTQSEWFYFEKITWTKKCITICSRKYKQTYTISIKRNKLLIWFHNFLNFKDKTRVFDLKKIKKLWNRTKRFVTFYKYTVS